MLGFRWVRKLEECMRVGVYMENKIIIVMYVSLQIDDPRVN